METEYSFVHLFGGKCKGRSSKGGRINSCWTFSAHFERRRAQKHISHFWKHAFILISVSLWRSCCEFALALSDGLQAATNSDEPQSRGIQNPQNRTDAIIANWLKKIPQNLILHAHVTLNMLIFPPMLLLLLTCLLNHMSTKNWFHFQISVHIVNYCKTRWEIRQSIISYN
jgi:hypothetical protein